MYFFLSYDPSIWKEKWNIYVSIVLQKVYILSEHNNLEQKEDRINVDSVPIFKVRYAEDTVLIAGSDICLQNVLTHSSNTFDELGLYKATDCSITYENK